MIAYRRPLRDALVVTSAALLAALPAHAKDKPRPAPPVKPAAEYVLHETHAQEHVTIAAIPCDVSSACPFFRLPYVSHGFLPVHVVVTNDRDEALALDDVRIQFIAPDGEPEAAATDEDLNRRLFSRKQAMPTRLPIIPITIHHEPIDKKVVNDDTDFGFQSLTVPPHSTVGGYVFYDTRQIDDPVMQHAELYVKEIKYNDAKGVKHELFAFTLPFDQWLKAQPKAADVKKVESF